MTLLGPRSDLGHPFWDEVGVGHHAALAPGDVDGDVPELHSFQGYIGFTGSTGGSTNYHRFDELKVEQECVFGMQ